MYPLLPEQRLTNTKSKRVVGSNILLNYQARHRWRGEGTMAKKTHTNSRLLAVSVIALTVSACASNPINIEPDSTVGRIASKAGEIGSSTWQRTKHVLRLDGTNTADDYLTADAAQTDEFGDDVELALLDAPADDDGLVIVDSLSVSSDATTDATLGVQPVALSQGYIHKVADGETLWDLSKRFTGDATNWKVMAELNGLDANGTVHPGLEVLFPGDMVIASRLPANNDALAEDAIDTQIASAERLPVPSKEDVADTTTEIVAASTAVTPVPATAIEVQAGETMWDLAKRTTGDATNWKVIAAANGMSEQDAAFIKFGQKLNVPTDIVKDATLTVADAAVPAAEPSTDITVAEEDINPIVKPVGEPKTTVVAAASQATESVVTPTDEEVTLIPAKFEAAPPVIENAEQEIAKLQSAETEVAADEAEWIMVSGTYYPKAIYNDANFSSTLMMRVSPGTKLEVTNAIGPWFEVKTEQGVGYVHTRDIK